MWPEAFQRALFRLSVSFLQNSNLCVSDFVHANVCTHVYIYGWPLNNMGGRGPEPPHSQKSVDNFGCLQILTTNSLLLTESLTDYTNSQLTHILYVICIGYYILTTE